MYGFERGTLPCYYCISLSRMTRPLDSVKLHELPDLLGHHHAADEVVDVPSDDKDGAW